MVKNFNEKLIDIIYDEGYHKTYSTPAWILAKFLQDQLELFGKTLGSRELNKEDKLTFPNIPIFPPSYPYQTFPCIPSPTYPSGTGTNIPGISPPYTITCTNPIVSVPSNTCTSTPCIDQGCGL